MPERASKAGMSAMCISEEKTLNQINNKLSPFLHGLLFFNGQASSQPFCLEALFFLLEQSCAEQALHTAREL